MSKYRALGLFLIVLLAAGGCREWESLSKKGNTWEFKKGDAVVVTVEITEKYAIGKTEYAQLTFKSAPNGSSMILSWDKDKKTFLEAGRTSYMGDGKPVFFMKETPFGKLKNNKNDKITGEDGTVLTYLGTEKLKTPLGEMETHKFSRTGSNKITGNPINQTLWFHTKKGILQFQDGPDVLTVSKFTEGKGGDPVNPAGKLDATKAAGVARAFVTDALAGGLDKVLPLFAEAGKNLDDDKKATVKMLIERLKSGTRPERCAFSFAVENSVSLRFRYQDNSAANPELMGANAVLSLVVEKDKLVIKDINVEYKKLVE